MQFLDLDKKLIKYSPKGWREGVIKKLCTSFFVPDLRIYS